jgi:outer membrane protein assembly factor BamB
LDTDNGVILRLIQTVRFLLIKVKIDFGKVKLPNKSLLLAWKLLKALSLSATKGQLFALRSGLASKNGLHNCLVPFCPSLIQSGRVITIANDGTVFAHDAVTAASLGL